MPRTTHTRTYVVLELSKQAYEEIKGKLETVAGYEQAFQNDAKFGLIIDMHGIALAVDKKATEQQETLDELWKRIVSAHIGRVSFGADPAESALTAMKALENAYALARAPSSV